MRRQSFLIVALAIVLSAPAHAYTRAQTGRWTPPGAWPERAIHLALLRGEGSPYHSKVLWYAGLGHHDELYGLWGWRPGEYSCSSYPDTAKFLSLTYSIPDAAIFCGGGTQLANGQYQSFGGTQGGTEFGIRKSYLFDQSTGSWTERDSMNVARWYPTSTLLPSGKVLVMSGSHNQDFEFFGGLVDTATTPRDNLLVHYSNAGNGAPDGTNGPIESQVWPSPRMGHSASFDPRGDQLTWFFGGKKENDTQPCGELWQMRRRDSPWRPDYYYEWSFVDLSAAAHPAGRMNHLAVWTEHAEAQQLIFGGTIVGDSAGTDVWRLWFQNGVGYTWTQVPIHSAANGPGPRTGHSGFWHAPSRSLIVFGGTGTPGGTPVDSSLYCLAFASDFSYATWSKLDAVGPSPRTDFGCVYESEFGTADTTHTFVFGGQLASGMAGDLWDLSLKDDPATTAHWTKVTDLGGNWPTARKGARMVSAGANRRIYLYGGRTFDSHLDDTVYVARFSHSGSTESREWTHYARSIDARYGHTMVFQGVRYQRKPEVYTPGGSFSQLSDSHVHQWYPQVFAWKPDTVFIPGPADTSLMMSLTTGTCTSFPDTGGFRAGNAVMYEPGKIMMAGTRDTQGGGTALGTTKFIDLNLGPNARWRTSSSMLGRVNHNLVLLPNGKVLVVGGTSVVGNQNPDHPVKQPEIWSPPSGSDSLGSWSGNGVLESQTNLRDYHSTAILLPDGRVLSASGNADPTTYSSGEIFCPPYLFNGDSLATRPTLISTTGRWWYNADVTFSVSGDTTIRRACLIRAGATTHAQDQSQRYVPLTLLSSSVRGDGVRQYMLKAPLDSAAAPPGDYLLFVSNSSGVPSIAQWVRVGADQTALFDTTAPDELSLSASFIYCDAITAITWSAPGDDGGTGTALAYDIRWSTSAINSGNFASATPLGGVGIPLLAATPQSGAGFSGLSPSTIRYVAGKTRDKAGNWSSLATASFATLSSCGGGGYGESMRPTRGREGGGAEPALVPGLVPVESSASADRSTARLIAEFDVGEPCSWRITFAELDGDAKLLAATQRKGVIQERSGGTWSATNSVDFRGGPVGVRSLARSCRLVFPAGSSLQALELKPRGFECWDASHSRVGNLLEHSADGPVGLGIGDEVRLQYAVSRQANAGEDCFFRVVTPAGALTPAAPSPGLPTASLPTVFALHRARPNPFSRATTISYDLPVARNVSIELFDVQGRRVSVLQKGRQDAGRYAIEWNGRLDAGGTARPGVFICRMTAGEFRAEQRVTVLP